MAWAQTAAACRSPGGGNDLQAAQRQPLRAFGDDEQLILENYFRKFEPKRSAAEIARLREQSSSFALLCMQLFRKHGDDPVDFWRRTKHGHDSGEREKRPPTRSPMLHGSLSTGASALQMAAIAAGKPMNKALANEMRLEAGKQALRRMAYAPTFAPAAREAVDRELRKRGANPRTASAREQREARASLIRRPASKESVVLRWAQMSFCKVSKQQQTDSDEGNGAHHQPQVNYKAFASAVRRYGKVSPKVLPDTELTQLFQRMCKASGKDSADAQACITPADFEAFTRQPPSERLRAWLSSADVGELQRVQTVPHGHGRSGEESWCFKQHSHPASHASTNVRMSALTADQVDALWRQWDATNDGKISVAELNAGMQKHPPAGWTGFDSKLALALAAAQSVPPS